MREILGFLSDILYIYRYNRQEQVDRNIERQVGMYISFVDPKTNEKYVLQTAGFSVHPIEDGRGLLVLRETFERHPNGSDAEFVLPQETQIFCMNDQGETIDRVTI